ncbi:MAG: hypothetical protein GY841_06870 [FCB group bacterium]|nr:hypothetical protein [FCB group bacterium]
MFLGIRKKYWLYLAGSALLAGLVLFARLSPVFAWQRTTMSGPGTEYLKTAIDDYPGAGNNLFRLDKKELMAHCLTTRGIDNIHLSLKLPDGLELTSNRFEPAALVCADRMYALDKNCRLIPYDTGWGKVNLPILTGLKDCHLFKIPDDFRVAEVVRALQTLKDEMPELFRQIADIDFSDGVEICLHLTTCRSEFITTGDGFARQLFKLRAIGGLDNWSGGGRYNLQYDDVIIKER